MPHNPQKARQIKGVDRANAILNFRLPRRPGQHIQRHIRVDMLHLSHNGVENGVVTGVALAVSAADQNAVSLAPGPLGPSDHNTVNLFLLLHRGRSGKVPAGLFIQLPPQPLPQTVVLRQRNHLFRQFFIVLGGKQQARHTVFDKVGNTAHTGSNGGTLVAGAFR